MFLCFATFVTVNVKFSRVKFTEAEQPRRELENFFSCRHCHNQGRLIILTVTCLFSFSSPSLCVFVRMLHCVVFSTHTGALCDLI